MVQFNEQILDLSIQHHGRVIILLQKEPINHEATKGYLIENTKNPVLTERTRESHKQQGQYGRKKYDNSEDKDSFCYRRLQKKYTRLHILQDPTNLVLQQAR